MMAFTISAANNLIDQPAHPAQSDHLVQFYETDEFLCEAVGQFVGTGLRDGSGVVVIATRPHRQGFEGRLVAQGFDAQAAQARGQLAMFDAAASLSHFMVGGVPDSDKFERYIGGYIRQVTGRYGRVRVYGEMVSLLWQKNDLHATIKLEELWNELGKKHAFTLLCGYHMRNFKEEAHDHAFHQICRVHSHVSPAKDFEVAELDDTQSQRRTIAALKQQARALQIEIAERKKIENRLQDTLQQLTAERARFEAVLRQMPAGVVIVEAGSGKLLLANEQINRIFRADINDALREPLTAETAEAIQVFHEDGRRYELEEWPLVRSLIQGEGVTGEEVGYLRGDGTRGTLSVSSAPIRDAEGRIVAAVASCYDISGRKKAQAEQAKASQLESIGLLAAGIAHDFNNILTAILGNISLAKLLAESNPAAVEALRQSEQASLRARDLTQQLLTFSKGGVPIKKPGSIADLLRDTATFALRGSNVRLDLDIPENLWTTVYDAGQMSQVINNLLINAVQAMQNGGTIHVSARNRYFFANIHQLAPGCYLQVDVRDEGEGIAPENLARIFDPYFTTKSSGSGLGLATSYSIIKRHDGWIGATSQPGEGATFTFFIPVAEVNKPLSASGAEIKEGQGRILLMDDEEDVRRIGSLLLTQIGYEVAVAADGDKTIALYTEALNRGRPFDLVILDLTVPGAMGGKECLEKLRAVDANVKAVVSSGYSNDPVMADFARHGFTGVVPKPYELEELSGTVYWVLRSDRRLREQAGNASSDQRLRKRLY